MHTHTPKRSAGLRWVTHNFSPVFSTKFCLLTRCFLVVVVLAEGLQIVWIDEARPYSSVRLDVIDYGRTTSEPKFCAFSAERLL